MTSSEARTEPGRARRSTSDLTRAAVSGWLGTALEFLDFQLYSLAAALVFTPLFFPDTAPGIGIILAMATYGVGYGARLLGAFVFGRIGDRVGRKGVLFFTIALMGVATTLIGALPTYAQVGVLAPILLVTLRLIQGFGAGAEIAGATTMLAEYAPRTRRGLIGSLVALGTNSATLVATGLWALLVALLSEDQLLSWGWRIPFLASFLVLFLALWIRSHLKESPVFEDRPDVVDGKALTADELKARAAQNDDAAQALLGQRKGRAFFVALMLRFGQAGNSGLIQTFLVAYLVTELGRSKTVPTNAILISSAVGFLTVPLVGWLSDRYGRRPLYVAFLAASALLAIPGMALIGAPASVGIVLGIIVLHNVSVLALFSLESVTMAELFGARTRFTQLAVAKEVGGILSTAIGPIIAASLTALFHSWWPLAIMLVVYSGIGLVGAFLMPEVRGRDLTRLEDAL
jgi:MFS transporter, MHS family, metabolite:H+ symporter